MLRVSSAREQLVFSPGQRDGLAGSPIRGPVGEADDGSGEVVDQQPTQDAEQDGYDGIEQVSQGALEDVGVGAGQGVEAVGSFGTDGRPHQRPAEEQPKKHQGRQHASHEEQGPDEGGDQQAHVALKERAEDAEKHGAEQHAQQREQGRGEIGSPLGAGMAQHGPPAKALFGGQVDGSDPGHAASEEGPDRQRGQSAGEEEAQPA